MRTVSLFTCLFLLVLSSSQAQSTVGRQGCLIYTLGSDTTAIGNYSLIGDDFTLMIADLTDAVTVTRMKGSFFPDGQLKTAEGTVYKPSLKGDSEIVYSFTLWCGADTTYMQLRRNGNAVLRKYPVKIMVANSLGGYALVYMPALLVNYALLGNKDSIASHHIVFNSARDFSIRKLGAKDFSAGSAVMGYFTLHLDGSGDLRTVDGIGTSWNIRGRVIAPVNMDSVIAVGVKNDRVRPHAAIVNKLDSTAATIGDGLVKIRYSRPSARGRQIFGGVVPYGRFWRTGADAATQLTTSRRLYFAGKELPPGQYSLWTLPGRDGWTLMINSQTNIWGTEYHADKDVLRVPMTVQRLHDNVELLTIQVVPVEGGGRIEVSWEKMRAVVGFSTAQLSIH